MHKKMHKKMHKRIMHQREALDVHPPDVRDDQQAPGDTARPEQRALHEVEGPHRPHRVNPVCLLDVPGRVDGKVDLDADKRVGNVADLVEAGMQRHVVTVVQPERERDNPRGLVDERIPLLPKPEQRGRPACLIPRDHPEKSRCCHESRH